MFDIKWIRQHPDAFDSGLAKRGLEPQAATLIALDQARRDHQTATQDMQAERNRLSKEIGTAKAKGENADAVIKAMADNKATQSAAEEALRQAEQALYDALCVIPNLPLDDVPEGADESANIEVRRVGTPPVFDFDIKDHVVIGEHLGMMDFETAAQLAGARFVVLSGDIARLERALSAFMLDIHTLENGYKEINPPILVNSKTMYGTGQLPKFADDLFRTEDGYWLIPTAEVPLTSLVAEQLLSEDDLPQRYTALTPCFRSEAGAAGRDTRGMIRQHQFNKVELVSITTPDTSIQELERMTACAEQILQRLGLPFRVMTLCSGDMGFSARKTYDIEVWIPSQECYREISSCSVCGDFQARLMNARYRPKDAATSKQNTAFVHTLNGSGLAVGRTLIAVLENYQNADGSVSIPEVLRPWMNNQERLCAPSSDSSAPVATTPTMTPTMTPTQ